LPTLLEHDNHLRTKQWESELSAKKSAEIIRLLGYKQPITINLDGLTIHFNNRDVTLEAGYCEVYLPSTLDAMVKQKRNIHGEQVQTTQA
jgi:hypothetical protein